MSNLKRNPVLTLVKLIFIVGVVLSLASYIFSMCLGVIIIFFSPEGLNLAAKFFEGIFFYIVFNIPITVLTPVNIGLLFLALWGVFCICWLISWTGPEESFPKVISKSLSSPFTRMFKNFLFTIPVASAMLFLAEIFLTSLQEAHGVPSGNINIPNPYELFFSASYASVSEEIGFRMIPIGLVAALWVLGKCWRSACNISVKSKLKLLGYTILYPEGGKAKTGLKRVNVNGLVSGISKPEWAIVLISAFIFGAAHIFAGSGWLIGKLTTTFIAGVFLGVIYLTYGITASILVHWFFNYYLTSFSLAYSMYGYPVKLFIGFSEISIIGFGFAGWIGLAVYLILKIARKLKYARHVPSGLQVIERKI